MTSNLSWVPINPSRGKELSTELKLVLRRKYDNQIDGQRLTYDDVCYLDALCDADIKDAKKLIDAIDKYGEISLVEKF